MDGARRVRRIASTPCADFDLHGRLRILTLCVGGFKRPDRLAIDLPDNLIGSPFDTVCLEAALAARVGVEGPTVVRCRLAFAEIIRLDLVRGRAEPLPVYLVEMSDIVVVLSYAPQLWRCRMPSFSLYTRDTVKFPATCPPRFG